MKHCLALALLATSLAAPLAAPLAAQETAAASDPAPLIVIRTADRASLALFEQMADLDLGPAAAAEGEHYVLTLDRQSEFKLTTAPGKVQYLELTADPGGLMQTFADDVAQARTMMQGVMTLAMTQQGMDAAAADELAESMFAFPHEIEALTLALRENPKRIREQGLDLEIGLTSKPGTFAAQLLSALKPNPRGVPVIPHIEGSVLDFAISLDGKIMPAIMSPFLDLGLSFSYPDKASRKAAMEVWNDMIRLYDGTFVMSMGPDMSMRGLYGHSDAAALKQLIESDRYLEMMSSQQPNRFMDIEVTPEAFRYRDAKFSKMLIFNEGPDNPMMPDGEMASFFGPVGKYLVMAGTEPAAKKLADAVADPDLAFAPLPNGAVMTMRMDMAEMMRVMAASAPMAAGREGMPETISIDVRSEDRTLRIGVKVR